MTFHFPHNCGAQLQCLALFEELKKLGHEPVVIDYEPPIHQNRYRSRQNPFLVAAEKGIKRNSKDLLVIRLARMAYWWLKTFPSWKLAKDVKIREEKFLRFRQQYLKETRKYTSLKQLRKDPPAIDACVCGSDQLWNPLLTGTAYDFAYFCQFGPEQMIRFSYAVSADFTDARFPEAMLKPALDRFKGISLRENRFLDRLQVVVEQPKRLRVDTDPTLFHKKDFYMTYETKTVLETEPFIVMYVMPDASRKKVLSCARALAEKTGYKLIDICGNPSKFNLDLPEHKDCATDEFLWYINHASYVVTNSFHGTAFSVIYEKEFTVIPHEKTGYRITELLGKIGLEDRIAASEEEGLRILNQPCTTRWNDVSNKIWTLTDSSRDYLKEMLS